MNSSSLPSLPREVWSQVLGYAVADACIISIGCAKRPTPLSLMLTCRQFHEIARELIYRTPLQIHISSPRWRCNSAAIMRSKREPTEVAGSRDVKGEGFLRRTRNGNGNRPLWSRHSQVQIHIHPELDYSADIGGLLCDTQEIVTLARRVSKVLWIDIARHKDIGIRFSLKIYNRCPWHADQGTCYRSESLLPVWSHWDICRIIKAFCWLRPYHERQQYPSDLLYIAGLPCIAYAFPYLNLTSINMDKSTADWWLWLSISAEWDGATLALSLAYVNLLPPCTLHKWLHGNNSGGLNLMELVCTPAELAQAIHYDSRDDLSRSANRKLLQSSVDLSHFRLAIASKTNRNTSIYRWLFFAAVSYLSRVFSSRTFGVSSLTSVIATHSFVHAHLPGHKSGSPTRDTTGLASVKKMTDLGCTTFDCRLIDGHLSHVPCGMLKGEAGATEGLVTDFLLRSVPYILSRQQRHLCCAAQRLPVIRSRAAITTPKGE